MLIDDRIVSKTLFPAVNIAVPGWNEEQSNLNVEVKDAVVQYVIGGALAGLGAAEIAEDIVSNYGAFFCECDVEFKHHNGDMVIEVELYLNECEYAR